MKQVRKVLFGVVACAAITSGVQAADHGDTPALTSLGRSDAKITDYHAWHTADGKFVMSVCLNPGIPNGVTSYQWPEDLTVRFHVDRNSAVDFSNAANNTTYGGTLVDPGHVSPEVDLEFAFDENNQPVLHADGLSAGEVAQIQVFAGLRDDPFINGGRNGKNSACIVAEAPTSVISGGSSTLLSWSTSKVPDIRGSISEHGGRALQSQKPVNVAMNTMRPRDHFSVLETTPDVVIHRIGAPAGFPNGRLLTDDIIDITMDPPFGFLADGVTPNGATAPTANDKPFLSAFPYLASPHG